MKTGYDFDLLCIGSGPAGQRAAIQAAKLGKRVAVVEKRPSVGGACLERAASRARRFQNLQRRRGNDGGSIEASVTEHECMRMAAGSVKRLRRFVSKNRRRADDHIPC